MRVTVLASGAGSLFSAVVEASISGALAVDVVGLVTDRPTAGVVDRAGSAAVPTVVVDPRDHNDRDDWDRALAATLDALRPDWVISLGFMRILGPRVLSRFPDRILNTHPALLPAFPGAHAVRDALRYGVHVTGCTVHLVDAGVDTGAVVAQQAVAVHAADDEARLHERIKVVERRLVIEVLAAVAAGGPPRRPVGSAPGAAGHRRIG